MRVVGVSGKAGSGKDALYTEVFRPAGWRKWSFAHTMKAMGMGHGLSLRDLVQVKPPPVREWLQRYGTEQHRQAVHEDFWLRATEYWLYVLSRDFGVDRVVFTDVRFPNEAAWVKRQNGMLVRLEGRGGLAGERAAHPSETALDTWDTWDLVLDNSTDGFDGLRAGLLRAGLL